MHPQALVLDPSGSREQAAALRAHGPVTPVQLPGDVAAWAVTHHATLTAVPGEPVTFAKDPTKWTAWRQGRICGLAADLLDRRTQHAQHRWSQHPELRDLTAKAFTARQVEQLRPRVTTVADQLLGQIRGLDVHAVDLRAAYALPLPLTVISELFGVPEADRAEMERL